nr:unnamed protein product [Callosobruchus analis]
MYRFFYLLNVLRISKPQATHLKCTVTRKFPHEEFWQTAIYVVDSMKFFCPQKRKLVLVPTLRNLKFTLKDTTVRNLDTLHNFLTSDISYIMPAKLYLQIHHKFLDTLFPKTEQRYHVAL